MGLESAGRAEIIRACQRDNEFIERLRNEINELILEVFGQRVWMKYQDYTKYGASFLYYVLTNFLGNQTLGEEYVGIVQVNTALKNVPSVKVITATSLMIFSKVFATPFINYVLTMIENYKQKQLGLTALPSYLNFTLDAVLQIGGLYRSFFPLLYQFHLAVFYANGKFYELSKRLAGVNYVLVRQYFGSDDKASRRHLKYLTWLSILNLALTAIHDSKRYLAERSRRDTTLFGEHSVSKEIMSSSASDVDLTKKCSLCLEPRRHPSVTPCGHLYCWVCIMDWLRNEGACPICRESIAPSRIVPLQNFS